MRMETATIFVGIIMFVTGLVLFYPIELGQTDHILRFIKNVGTFIGLGGIGVTLAGILLYLINRNEPPLKENFDI